MATTDKTKAFKAPIPEPAQVVASLNLSTIAEALHENALAKAMAKAKTLKSTKNGGVRIINSAVNDDDGNSVFNGGGMHKITVCPKELKDRLTKDDAVAILKEYVAWFLGPDQAKEVTHATVKDLADVKLRESRIMKSFKQFLLESEEKSIPVFISEAERDPAAMAKDAEEREKNQSADKGGQKGISMFAGASTGVTSPTGSSDSSSEEDSIKSLGYYYSYTLKIRENDNKKTSNQNPWRGIIKSLMKNVFDIDAKITMWGTGSSGDTSLTFSIKDIIDKIGKGLKQCFGDTDPKEVIRRIDDRFEKTYPGAHPIVRLRDRKTLEIDLKDAPMNAKLRSQVQTVLKKSDFFLWIQIDRDAALKEAIGTKEIANILNESWSDNVLKKIWRKASFAKHRGSFGFRLFEEKNIVHLENYADKHNSTQKVRAVYEIVPQPDTLQDIVGTSRNAAAAWSRLEKQINNLIGKNKYAEHCERARQCNQVWKDFQQRKKNDSPAMRQSLTGTAKDEYYKDFLKKYKKTFDDTRDASLELSESISSMMCRMIDQRFARQIPHRMLNEADEVEFTFDAVKNYVQQAIDIEKHDLEDILKKSVPSSDTIKDDELKKLNVYVKCNTMKYLVNNTLKYFKTDDLIADIKNKNELQTAYDNDKLYGIVVNLHNPSALGESISVKDDIMKIIFKTDQFKNMINEADISISEIKPGIDKIKEIEEKINQICGIAIPKSIDNADAVIVRNSTTASALARSTPPKSIKALTLAATRLLPSTSSGSSTPSIVNYAFVVGFTVENGKVKEKTSSDDSSDSSSISSRSLNSSTGVDVYIAPLKKISQEDQITKSKDSSRYY